MIRIFQLQIFICHISFCFSERNVLKWIVPFKDQNYFFGNTDS